MKTPVYDFVTEYCRRDMSRMHMPGHKGQCFLGCEDRDITEISGADVLHQAGGILKESQENAAALFGAGSTLYSTEGSSLCIKVMLAVLLQAGKTAGSRPYILAGRNVHRAMVDACALLDLDIEFIIDLESGNLCTGRIGTEQLSQILQKAEVLPIGVYITSPDYLGQIADISGLAKVCRQFGLPLVVDNAHGAYMRFLDSESHPMQAGAAMCCDSAHKTLPVLTGGAYLHMAQGWAKRYENYAVRMMAVFASTSPSYLILQSLDLCNRYLAENYAKDLKNTVQKIGQIKQALKNNSIPLLEGEALKIVIDAAAVGYSGMETAEEMRQYNIECEYADKQYVVLMPGVESRKEDYLRLERWSEKSCLRNSRGFARKIVPCYGKAERACSIREAVFGDSKLVSVEDAIGRICALETVTCPPAIPIAISGERITEEMAALFRAYGIEQIAVLTE